MPKGKKIALIFICLNPMYWPYIKDVIEDCNKYFLTDHKDGHQVDFFLWSDIPDATYGATVYPTEPVQWPLPTLMRYHLFLQQEEKLAEYDYIFYMDADMRVVAPIGNEILGEGLTAAQHPMYALRPHYQAPYEPNTDSAAFIHRPVHYYAGGFQGGTAKEFIKAMKAMKKNIDKDFMKNYTARWNDESHWNKYLFDNPPVIVLSPSYIYPDSLIKEYYEPLWGCSYEPKIVTLTKPFSVSKEGGAAVAKMLGLPEGSPLQKPTAPNTIVCEKCGDSLTSPTQFLVRVMTCNGPSVPHQVEAKNL